MAEPWGWTTSILEVNLRIGECDNDSKRKKLVVSSIATHICLNLSIAIGNIV